MAQTPAELSPTAAISNDTAVKSLPDAPAQIAEQTPLRWLWLAAAAAAVVSVLALLLLVLRWRADQELQQHLFERNVNSQVQAIDQQLHHFDTVIGDLARVMRQSNGEKNSLFADLTESWPQRYKVMHFVALMKITRCACVK